MKSLNQHIAESKALHQNVNIIEKLKINKNYKGVDDNTLMEMFMNPKDDDELLETIGSIVETASAEPDIYDDGGGFRMYDYFEPWQDAAGWWDRTYKILENEFNNNIVVGWYSGKDFDDVEKKIPKLIYNIIYQVDLF